MASLTFLGGPTCDFPAGITGFDLAKAAPHSLGKNAIAMKLNGDLVDLHTVITEDATVEFFTRESPEGLSLIRHTCSHVLAEAVQKLYPCTKLTIGPSIKDGFYYDFYCGSGSFTIEQLPVIEEAMREIISRDKPLVRQTVSREEAIEIFRDKGEDFKVKLVSDIPVDQSVKIYHQGDWYDLCQGPHVTSVGQVGQHFKLTKVSGAYWRGDSSNPMLSRIYGTAWATEDDLKDHMRALERAEKCDHRRLGTELDLFHCQEEGPGVVFWHRKGWTIFQVITDYLRRRLGRDYEEVSTPQVLNKSLWEASGHLEWYRDNMFSVESMEDKEENDHCFVLKPMNCPGHLQLFKHRLRSYRDLPMRLAEFGVVHRDEPSGAMHGLMRVRGFTQDDAHIFCTKQQMFEECLKLHELVLSIYKDFGFTGITVKLSTRPEKRIGSDESWDRAEQIMTEVFQEVSKGSVDDLRFAIQPGEGAFYGPKFEYTLTDALGREWQCGTIQIDFNLPNRFGVSYVDADGVRKEPVLIHRAVFGSVERFIGILIEHYGGNFPLWLAPVQVVIAGLTPDVTPYVQEIAERCIKAKLRIETDTRNETISYKVREHHFKKIPVVFVVGRREVENRSVSIRRLGQSERETTSLDEAIKGLSEQAFPPDLMRDTTV